jgi:hypothetical protein
VGLTRVALIACALACSVAHADPPGSVLGATPREQALKLYAQATKMFDDQDFIAAAVTFGEAATLFARVDRDASGKVVDDEAHSYRSFALSNEAASYSRANLYVEAYTAFAALREQFGDEMAQRDHAALDSIDDAIKTTSERIGTLVLAGLPAGELEIRIDGRLERRDVRTALRLDEGTHSLEIVATAFKPYTAELAIVGGRELRHDVALEPLRTPARVRIESTVARSRVDVDGRELEAPAELDLPPGRHHVVVSSEAYAPQATDIEVSPGERQVLRVELAPARAPLGLRVEPSYVLSLPLRTDTPFGSFGNGVALALFHDAVRVRNLRFGVAVEYTARQLNALAIGAIATWCPDAFVRGTLTWCPVTVTASGLFGSSSGEFGTGDARGRAVTSLELRRTHGYARVSAGLQLEDYVYNRTELDGSVQTGFFLLASTVVEVAVGLDL